MEWRVYRCGFPSSGYLQGFGFTEVVIKLSTRPEKGLGQTKSGTSSRGL